MFPEPDPAASAKFPSSVQGLSEQGVSIESTSIQGTSTQRTPGQGTREPAMPGTSDLQRGVAERLVRNADFLVPAIIQQHDTGDVLMLGWMDDEALHRTLTTGRVTFYSRSRRTYWRKGDTSGHAQYVKSVSLDCDGDTLLVRVDQVGEACHTGTHTCFDGRSLLAVEGFRAL